MWPAIKAHLSLVGLRDTDDAAAEPRNLWPGFTVTELARGTQSGERIPQRMNGVVVASIIAGTSPGAIAGLRPGDIIIAVNDIAVGTMREFYEALNAKGGRAATLMVLRNGNDIRFGI